jgi:hypothetical protein
MESEKRRKYKRRWTMEHPDSTREYYRKNRDHILEKTRAYALAHPDQVKATQARWRAANRETARARSLAYKRSHRGRWKAFERRIARAYGITVEDYARAELSQGRACAGCCERLNHAPGERGVHVDHCHASGVFRGLLCYSCNAALGLVRDRQDVLERLIRYLGASHDAIRRSHPGVAR